MKAYRAIINTNTVIDHTKGGIEKSADNVKYFSDINDARKWVQELAPNLIFADETLHEEIYGSPSVKDEMATVFSGVDVQVYYSANIARIEIN